MVDDKFLAICDCGFSAESGRWEVIDQCDWVVPTFKEDDLKDLCEKTDCTKNCEKCVVTRVKKAVFEDQY